MEQLLILDAPDASTLRRSLERVVRIVQEGSDRLLIVEGSKVALGRAAKLHGVSATDSLPKNIADSLSPGEQTFLAAWRKRHAAMATKTRKGEGLSWGTKGYRPP